MTVRSFTGYLNSTLFGAEAPSLGNFTIPTTSPLNIVVSDGLNDEVIEGDSVPGNNNTEQSQDAGGDQFLYISDSSNSVLSNGTEFFLEQTFQFEAGGQTYTGYYFEDENGLDFTVLPPGVPAGSAEVTSLDFSPTPDEVNYEALSSGDETIDSSLFSQLDLSGADVIDGGTGGDTIVAGGGNDTIEGGIGSDTISGGAGNDVVYGDEIISVNAALESGQADNSFSLGAVDGWFNTGSGGVIERWGNTFLGTSTDDGGSFIELDVNPGGGVDHLQTNLELTTGVDYVITIDHAARTGGGVNDDFEITHNGTVIATVSPSSVGYFTTSSFTITGLAGTDTIGFREIASQSNGVGVLLDEFTVSLATSSVAASPESYNDTIDGGDGDDTIYGQEGDDTITGGAGNDLISGGVGADTIVLTDGGGTDTVSDFVIGEDTLNVSGLTDANGGTIKTNDVTVTSDGQSGSILTFDNGEVVILRDIAPDSLDTASELNAVGIPCFTKGTLIETKNGLVSVEDLRSGMSVRVASGDYAELRLNLNRHVTARELAQNNKLAPVRILAGALGQGLPVRDLLVSRQHRMVLASHAAQRMFGTSEVLVATIRLTALPNIEIDHSVKTVDYFHLIFDKHEIIFAEGAPTESFLTAPEGIKALNDEARDEFFTLFPETALEGYTAEPACPIPCNQRQNRLVSRHLKNGKNVLSSWNAA